MNIKWKEISLGKVFFIFCIVVIQINCIFESCSLDTDCPSNSYCGFRNYCVCNNGWIMNCSTPAQEMGGDILTATITQSYTYFVITPENLYEYIKFAIKISTNETLTEQLIVTLWGQTGYLSDLTSSNSMDTINLPIDNTNVQTIQTTYFEFGLQPNGQSQALYLGIKLNSTTTTIYTLGLTAEQQPAYSENTFRIILTVLLSILSIACFVMLAFCIYKRRRMNEMRERAEQEKEVKPTEHFDQYMPKVTADRVKMPLQVCSVCLNDILIDNFVRLTICKHLFHAECIDSWCKKNNSCPICRQELDLESCQKILGEEFDLSEVVETKRTNEETPVEVEMMQKNLMYKQPRKENEEIFEENSMRRSML